MIANIYVLGIFFLSITFDLLGSMDSYSRAKALSSGRIRKQPPSRDPSSFPPTNQSAVEWRNSQAATLTGLSGDEEASWAARGRRESSQT